MAIDSLNGASGMQMPFMQGMQQGGQIDAEQMLAHMEEANPELHEKVTTSFDADGSGDLSEEELAALQEKMEGMHQMMAQMGGMQAGQGDGPPPPPPPPAEDGSESGNDDLVSSLMDAVYGSEESTDAADLDGDGVVSVDELAEYLGVESGDLSKIGQGPQREQNGSGGQGGGHQGFGQRAMSSAIEAYLTNITNEQAEGALSTSA